jgi:hypothetical protein
MWVLRLLLVWGLAAASPAYADGISGTYVGIEANGAFLVQIVETTGGQLTGRYEQTSLQPSGKLEQLIASITGASDGHTVVVTIKATELPLGGIAASGTLEGSQLHLSGGSSGTKVDLNLATADEATYRNQVAVLTGRARAMNEARAQADELAHLIDLTKKLTALSSEADAQLGKFPPIERRYRELTEWMTAALVRQQSIYGRGQASLARGQVGLAINQAGMEAAQLHSGLQGANKDVDVRLQPLLENVVNSNRQCHFEETKQSADFHAACLKFFDAAKQFKQSIDRLVEAFSQAEKVWLVERRKQEGIMQASIASR